LEAIFFKGGEACYSTRQEDRDFFWILLVSFIFYSLLGFYMVSLPLVEIEVSQFGPISPRTARFILHPPSSPEQVPPALEQKMVVPEKKKLEPILPAVEPKKKPLPPPKEKRVIDPQEIRKKNQETARKSGLLKLLGHRKAAKADTMGESFFPFEMLTSFETLRKPDEEMLMIEDEEEGEMLYIIMHPKPEIKTFFLGGKITTAVENPFEIRGSPLGLQYRGMESILKVVQTHQSGITFLYNKALQHDPDLKGHITFECTILADGRLTHVRIVSSTLHHSEFEFTLLDYIRAWRFESIPKGEVIIVYPIGFSPAS